MIRTSLEIFVLVALFKIQRIVMRLSYSLFTICTFLMNVSVTFKSDKEGNIGIIKMLENSKIALVNITSDGLPSIKIRSNKGIMKDRTSLKFFMLGVQKSETLGRLAPLELYQFKLARLVSVSIMQTFFACQEK